MIELDDDALAASALAAGGVFVPDCVVRLGEECDVVVCGANQQLWLPARAVYVDERGGAGLELIGFSAELKARLAELEIEHSNVMVIDEPASDDGTDDEVPDPAMLADAAPAPDDGQVSVAVIDVDALDDAQDDDDDLAIPIEASADGDASVEVLDGTDGADGAPVEALADETLDHIGGLDAAADPFDDERAPRETSSARLARAPHERLRGLNLVSQIKMAATGELHERIVLERLYGKNVWETLLRNPRLTAPEVSRIARYGSLPRVLLEIILANNAWLQVPEVRRALLANPRLGNDQITKILRLTPKHELKLAAIQTAYPQAVRNAAKAMLRNG
jgi:hypothetical protein